MIALIVAKTITWRVVSTIPFAIVTFAVTGSLAMSTTLVMLDVVGRTALYAAHEWVWSRSETLRMAKSFATRVLHLPVHSQ